MKKNKIIFVHFNRFLDNFDWERYELDLLSKSYLVEVHVLINLVHPHLKNKNYNKFSKNKKIKIFKNLDEWREKINDYQKKNHFIFQTFPYNFVALKIFQIVKKKGFKTSIIYINNLPTYSDYKISTNTIENFHKKFLSAVFRPKHSLATIKKILITCFFKIFKNYFSTDFSIIGGNKKSNFSSLKTIRINSWDYSKTLRKSSRIVNKKNYILYLSDGETRYQSDSQLWNTERVENSKLYLKKLNLFFNKIEKKYNLEILIAAHPRSNPKLTRDIELGKRKSFYGKTFELTKNAKFIMSCGSTALSYAVLLKKPILFIFSSSQQKKNVSFNKFANFFANILNCKRVDIDNYFNAENESFKPVDQKSYEKYQKNFIVNKANKQNYKILIENLR